METWGQGPAAGRALSLGNFLSGMETRNTAAFRGDLHPLETSLVEWKLREILEDEKLNESLETSLVEWKLRCPTSFRRYAPAPLGNFLSGMETTELERFYEELSQPWKLP